jgi:hypothetical protein
LREHVSIRLFQRVFSQLRRQRQGVNPSTNSLARKKHLVNTTNFVVIVLLRFKQP